MQFKVVFQPKDKRVYKSRRFFVTLNTLEKYVGEKNAKEAIKRAFESREDKYTVRLRKHGRIDFYVN